MRVVGRHAQVIEEDLRRRVVHHGADRVDADRVAARERHVDQKDRKGRPYASSPVRAGWVRASSSMRSECSAREVQIFCPLMM